MGIRYSPPQFGSSYEGERQRQLVEDTIRAFNEVSAALDALESGESGIPSDGSVTGAKLADPLEITTEVEFLNPGYLHYGQTALNTGVGFWLANNQFSFGNPAGHRMVWNGTTITGVGNFSGSIDAGSVDPTSGSLPLDVFNVANQGWTTTNVFSSTDADTVSWTAGTFTTAAGVSYSIGSGNTGNITARTYIFLDINVSTTAYQITTTAANAVGSGRVLIAVAEPRTDGAFVHVFGGGGGIYLPGSDLNIGFVGLINGDFELGTKKGWNNANGNDGTLVNLGIGSAHRGRWVMEVPNGTGGPNQFSEHLPIGPGEKVLAQAWAQRSTIDAPSAGQQLAVRFYDGSSVEITRTVLATANNGDSNWQFLRGAATAPSLSASYVIDLGEATGTGDWWWDDVGTVVAPRDSDVNLGNASGTINLGSQISGTLTAAFAEAGLINANVTINADGTLSGAGGGQASLNSLPGDISTTQIEDDAITTPKINANAVTAAKIAANTITAAQIAALTITAAEIAANTITAAKIAASTITGDLIAANTITAGNIAALTITAAEIAGSTITGAKIAGLTITGDHIVGETITAGKLATHTITANEIYGGTITTNEIATSTITAGNLAATLIFTNELELSSTGKIRKGKTSASSTTLGLWIGDDGASGDDVHIGDANTYFWFDYSAGTIRFRGDLDFAASTFAPSWTGFSSAPSGNLSYINFGSYAMVWNATGSDIVGTSNSSAMTITNLPSAVQPGYLILIPCIVINDDAYFYGQVSFSGATMTFNIADDSSSGVLSGSQSFVTSGGKGLPPGFILVYPMP